MLTGGCAHRLADSLIDSAQPNLIYIDGHRDGARPFVNQFVRPVRADRLDAERGARFEVARPELVVAGIGELGIVEHAAIITGKEKLSRSWPSWSGTV